MGFDKKGINKILIISNVLILICLITMIITNYTNYMKYITTNKNLTDTTIILKSYSDKIGELNKKINTKDSNKISQINDVSTQFLNAFFSYDALSKNKIYDNIKPYSTVYLVNKLEPTKENQLESDVNYKVSIENIRLYSKSIQDDNDASILVLADQNMNVNNVDSTTPILIELKLRNINNKWLVDDLLINKPLNNVPFIN